jgi:hypothetical protein
MMPAEDMGVLERQRFSGAITATAGASAVGEESR